MQLPHFDLEIASLKSTVAGVDEVGYGAWAGPVVAAAAVVNPACIPQSILSCIRDSKSLSASQRETIFDFFVMHTEGLSWAYAYATVDDIAQHNVLRATQRAMVNALLLLKKECDVEHVLVDGCHLLPITLSQQAVVKGDCTSLSIALASILAKVTRDRLMTELSKEYPAFGWERNKGYGTKHHQEALSLYGPTPHHRLSYKIFRAP